MRCRSSSLLHEQSALSTDSCRVFPSARSGWSVAPWESCWQEVNVWNHDSGTLLIGKKTLPEFEWEALLFFCCLIPSLDSSCGCTLRPLDLLCEQLFNIRYQNCITAYRAARWQPWHQDSSAAAWQRGEATMNIALCRLCHFEQCKCWTRGAMHLKASVCSVICHAVKETSALKQVAAAWRRPQKEHSCNHRAAVMFAMN